MNRNQELEDKLPLYALHALEEPEMKEIEAYINDFPEVATELKKLRESVNLLHYAAPLRTPPPSVKSTILNYAKANPRQAPASVAQPKQVAAPQKKVQRPASKAPAAAPPDFWQNLRDWWHTVQTGPALPVGLALSLVAIGFMSNRLLTTRGQLDQLTGVVSGLNSDIDSLESDIDQLTASNQSLESTVANLESENGELLATGHTLLTQLENQQQVIAYAGDANSHRLALPGTDAQPAASGGLFIRPDTGELLLVITQLEPLTEEQIYQLWLIEDQPMSAGLIQITPDGTGIFEIDVALDAIDFSAVGVSIEPAGGSDLPTGDIVLLANA